MPATMLDHFSAATYHEVQAMLGTVMRNPKSRPAKMALADWLAERGHDEYAYAFEWAAAWGRHPHDYNRLTVGIDRGHYFAWQYQFDGFGGHAADADGGPRLPAAVVSAIDRLDDDTSPSNRGQPWHAFAILAAALAALRRDAGLPPDPA